MTGSNLKHELQPHLLCQLSSHSSSLEGMAAHKLPWGTMIKQKGTANGTHHGWIMSFGKFQWSELLHQTPYTTLQVEVVPILRLWHPSSSSQRHMKNNEGGWMWTTKCCEHENSQHQNVERFESCWDMLRWHNVRIKNYTVWQSPLQRIFKWSSSSIEVVLRFALDPAHLLEATSQPPWPSR